MPLPTIPSGNVASATAATTYEIANSVRMNDGDSPYFAKTPTAGDRAKWTFSCWFKLGDAYGSTHGILVSGGNSADQSTIRLDSGVIDWVEWDQSGSAVAGRLITNKLFRDPTAWYHLVCTWDTDNATSGNRMRMYINGVEETAFSTDTNPSSGYDSAMNNNVLHEIGRQSWNSSGYFDGYLAEMAFCDGQAYAASDFGEFSEDSPSMWVPKDISTLTFGSRGWYLDFEDSGDLDDDESGNGNDWTANNLAATDQCVDSPTNNYCVLYPEFYSPDVTFSEGNCKVVEGSNNWRSAYGNMGVTNGKWYWEARISYQSGNECYLGIAHEDHMNGTNVTYGGTTTGPQTGGYDYIGYSTRSFGIYSNGNQDYPSTTTYAGTFNDATYIMGIALDMDNRKMYMSRNGVWVNSSNNGWDSSTFSDSTGDMDISGKIPATGFVFPACSPNQSTFEFNFGSPPFSITSGNSDANGYGNFEYSVPSGFYALCTKNIGEFGG